MHSNKLTIRSVIPLALASLIIAYITGGVIFVINEKMVHGKTYIIFLLCCSLAITALLTIATSRNNKLGAIYEGFISSHCTKSDKLEFYSFYNISHHEIIILFFIILLGFALRIWGYDWGHAVCLNPDEGSLVNPAIVMAENKTLYSSFVAYPDQFTSKIVAVILSIYSTITNVELNRDTMVQAHHIFRAVVAIFGTATIYTAYLIGNRLKHSGLIFAFFVAVYPHFNSYSKMVTGDITSLFFLSLTIIFSLRYMDNLHNKYIILMSMTAALATLEKWHGAVGIGYIGILLILCVHDFKTFIKNGTLAMLSYVLWLLVFAPNIIIDLKTTIIDGFISIAVFDGSKGWPYYIKLWDYVLYGIQHIGGIIYIFAFFIGLSFMIIHRSHNFKIFILCVCKTIIICLLNRHHLRWVMELYFAELLIISFGLSHILFSERKIIKSVAIILMCIISTSLLTGSMLVTADASFTDQDSRITERHDCLAMGITQENMLSQYYTGLNPASGCDSEYPVNSYKITDWNEYIIEKDGKLYRSSSCPDYVCFNISKYTFDNDMSAVLSNYPECKKILEYRVVCADTFETPFEYMRISYNDFKVIFDNIKNIIAIFNGGLVGDEMDIYYLGNLSYI